MHCTALITVATMACLPANAAGDESFFIDELYPIMRSAQCNLCHQGTGVASATRLQFPGKHASREQIEAFGLQLMDLVDRDDPQDSLLFLMPTNREDHTGGERIEQGSDQEAALLSWITYLAELSDEQVALARAKIARAEQFTLQPLTVRRLTHRQYDNTVRDLLGDLSQPSNHFPKEDFVRGFKNQVEVQGVSPLQAAAYSKAAARIAASAVRRGEGLLSAGKPVLSSDVDSVQQFVRQFGLRAFRRPLQDSEVLRYATLFRGEATRTGKTNEGAKLVVEAMLQSPHFLFRIERGGADGLNQYPIASRLSYFLWDTMPNDELLAQAKAGKFSTARQVEAIARRMLEDPRARASMNEFLAQWMRLDRVRNATRDRRRFQSFNAELAWAMAEETRRLFSHVVWQDKNFMEFFTADYTFINSDLANLYGLPEPAEDFAKVKYPPTSGRSGILGHGSFLLLTSKPAETSPTERGLFIRNHFLGHEVPPPPPGVNTMLPTITEDAPMTNRQRLAVHLNSEACASCHRLIDPIGLGFEQYDPIGRFREKLTLQFVEKRETRTAELEVDTTAHIQGIPDSQFSTPRELGKILAENETCQACVVKQLFRYAFGRQETMDDRPTIDELLVKFRDSGFRFQELIVAIVTSKLFLQEGSR